MPATYNGLHFRTSLEARWAAFFDLAEWEWHANPSPVNDWSPDFRVTFPCTHSECGGSHTLLIAVLPITRIDDFKGHPCLSYAYGRGIAAGIDGGAAFGISPSITTWEMAHGAGGGIEEVSSWVRNADALWTSAKTLVQQR